MWHYLAVIFETVSKMIAWERWEGTIEHTFMAPISRFTHMVGQTLFSLVYGLLHTGIILGVVALFFKLDLSGANLVGGLLMLVAGSLSFVGLGIVASVLPLLFPERGAQMTHVIQALLLLISGVYFPISVLPGWMQPLARLSPATFVLEGMRATILEGAPTSTLGPYIWPLLLAGVIAIPLTNEQVLGPTLIIDADDTLWENNIYYEECIAAFVELMAARGFGREEAERTLEAVERERTAQVGYAPEEFAHSLVIAYQRLCERHGQPVEDEVADVVWEIGQAVVEYPILLLEGVAETLARLSGHCRLLLLTKGDREVQESKLARSGLGHLFDGVHIVPEKDAEVIRSLLAHYGLRPEQTWVVGNSPRSDINPALEAGVGAIYVPHPNTWHLEQEEIAEPERVTVLNRLSELAALFLDAERGQEA